MCIRDRVQVSHVYVATLVRPQHVNKVTWLVISVQYADKFEANEYAFTGGLINLKITLIDAIVR